MIKSRCLLIPAGLLLAAASVAQPQQAARADGPDFGLDEPLPQPPGTFRIASYNLENVFDDHDDPDLSGEHDDAPETLTPARGQALAEVIRAIDADILAVQEIESLQALEWFRDNYLQDMGYDHAISIDVGYYRGIEQGVLSRFPINDAEVRLDVSIDDIQRPGLGWDDVPTHTTEPMSVQRSPLMVEIQVDDDYALTLFVMHHKSGGNYRWKREAEAVRNLEWIHEVQQRDQAGNTILLGDFNAAPWDKSLRLYLEAGFVDIMSHRTVRGEEAPLYKSHRSDRVIDYILMNAPAYNELVIGSPHILGTFNPDESWNWRTDPYPAGYASDHYPLVFDVVPEDRN